MKTLNMLKLRKERRSLYYISQHYWIRSFNKEKRRIRVWTRGYNKHFNLGEYWLKNWEYNLIANNLLLDLSLLRYSSEPQSLVVNREIIQKLYAPADFDFQVSEREKELVKYYQILIRLRPYLNLISEDFAKSGGEKTLFHRQLKHLEEYLPQLEIKQLY